MAGCAAAPSKSPDTPEPSADAVAAPPAAPRVTRAERIEQWLSQGDRALSADQLLTPLADNAHDRYRAVLLYDPDNSRAISGLQAIALRYLDLARSAAARGAFSQALGYLSMADSVDPGNSLVAEFEKAVRTQQEHMLTASPLQMDGKTVELNSHLLRQRSPTLVEELQTLAQQVREREEFILIIAVTDADGRWIYQQMREAVPGYLLRGDIKLGSPPRIELQPL